MEVNKNESINSLFETLDEWLNDENRIVSSLVCIQYIGRQPFSCTA